MSYLTTTRNRLFPSILDEFFKEDFFTRPTNVFTSPVTDIVSNDDEYIIEMEVAGFKKKDISINITDDILTVKGETERKERKRSFERSFTLDGSILNYDGIESTLKDGILTITLPKKEEQKPKTIDISIS